MEHAPLGTLHDLIHKKIKDNKLAQEAKRQLANPRILFNIAKSVAEGLQYLHSQGIIHRNLKTQHVLIFSDWTAKIGLDLKHCYYLNKDETETPAGIGSIGLPQYKSPEEFADGRQSKMVDLYSYAVLLSELYSKKKPWRDTVSAKICQKVLTEQLRPDLPDGVQPEIIQLIQDCWKQNASERPTIDSVLERLASLETNLV
jgi:serine/threonine protein kinase